MSENCKSCKTCAYKEDIPKGMWCPYHDIAVSEELICDDYLDDFQSQQWQSLMDDLNGTKAPVPQIIGADIITYICFIMHLILVILTAYLIFT